MKAGPELDALIAANVFGTRLLSEGEMSEEAERVWQTQPLCRSFMMGFHACLNRDGDWEFTQNIPRYSTCIADAWKVLEKLRDMDCDVSVESCGASWCVHHAVIGYGPMAESAPLAICLAALKVSE